MDWFDRIPKVELHLHLEGAIPHTALFELMKKYKSTEVTSSEGLRERFIYSSFEAFIQAWNWKSSFIREYEDFTFITEEIAKDLVVQNIQYAEVFFSPSDFSDQGLDIQRISEAIRKGLNKAPSLPINLIADLVRDNGASKAMRVLEEIIELQELGIIGIGLGGSEHKYPPHLFKEVFKKAKEYGFYTTVHAGEAAGANSVWEAINDLKPDRIGHGTLAIEDPALVNFLAENQIPIEMCPISNIKTKVVPSIEKHPIRAFYEKGIPVSVNTDDPKMFQNSLAEEYRLLQDKLQFTNEDIRQLVLNGIHTSWLSPEEKKRLLLTFINDKNW